MAFKDNLEALKTEFSAEERFIEKFIRGERFIRKYKFHILAILFALLVYFGGSFAMGVLKERSIRESNQIYMNLMGSPDDKTKLTALKEENLNLYTAFLMQKFAQDQNNPELLNELDSLYKNEKLNVFLKDILALDLNKKSPFLKDFEKVLEAYRLLEQDKIQEADILLSQIRTNPALEQIAKNLKHYRGVSQ